MNKTYARILGALMAVILTISAFSMPVFAETVSPELKKAVENFELLEEEEVQAYLSDAKVAAKVEQLAKACIASGADTEYEIALWMHNWLINNANYDQSHTQYGPEGVLLRGKGVCQSYALAYMLLLDRMGIEARYVNSKAMDHAWNLVRINRKWYHVDVTWDDPAPGNYENHNYFCLSDRYMRRDHSWEKPASYPACSSDDLNIMLNSPEFVCADSPKSLSDGLEAAIVIVFKDSDTPESKVIPIYNNSFDKNFNLLNEIKSWLSDHVWMYNMYGYGWSSSGPLVRLTLVMQKTDFTAIDYASAKDFDADLKQALSRGDTKLRIRKAGNASFVAQDFYAEVSKKINDLAKSYGCSINRGYRASNSGRFIEIDLTYKTVNLLPEPVKTIKPIAGTDFCFTAADGQSITSSSLKGKPALLVYGNTACKNTRALLDSLRTVESLLNRAGAEVAIGLDDTAFASCSLADYAADYASFRCGKQDDYSLYKLLAKCGYTGSITFPAAFVLNEDGNIIYHSMGSVNEPLRIAALLCSDIEKGPAIPKPEVNNILSLPAALTEIEDSAFMNLKDVTEIRFGGDQIRSIGRDAFSGLSSLRIVVIPDSVKSIGKGAFSKCDKLVICASNGSAAHDYAKANKIPCIVR